LKEKLQSKVLVLGDNFYFGSQKQGNVTWLKSQGSKDDIEVKIAPLQKEKGLSINSTQIKIFLREGQVEQANLLLGHNFSLIGKIAEGQKLGRKIGYPTANFSAIEQLTPAKGVYYGYLKVLDKKVYSEATKVLSTPKEAKLAVINIGERPTVKSSNKQTVSVEAHIIGEKYSDQALYEKNCVFYFKSKLRDEIKFPSLEVLKAQIAQDIKLATCLSSKKI